MNAAVEQRVERDARVVARLRPAALAVNLALALASVALAVLAAEWGVRIFHPQLTYRFPQGLFVSDPAVGYRLTPRFSGILDTPEYRVRIVTNAQGLRESREYGPKGDARRVLMLGDSFTMGVGVPVEDTAAKQLERRLRAGSGRQFEVLNAGVPGYSTRQESAYLQRYGFSLEPDLVVVGLFLGNDVADNASPPLVVEDGYLVPPNEAHNGLLPFSVRRFLSVHSQLYHALEPLRQRVRGRQEEAAEAEQTAALFREVDGAPEPAWEPTYAALADVVAAGRGRGAPIGVVLMPSRAQVDPGAWASVRALLGGREGRFSVTAPNERLVRFCREMGVPVLDMLPAFQASPRSGSLYFALDHHWTVEGNALAADQLEGFVRELLPG